MIINNDIIKNMKIILASKSPRRTAILERLGLQFEVVVPTSDEITNKTKPEEIVVDLAFQKAKNVQSSINKEATIIAADTIVIYNDNIFGKPVSETEAFEMLSHLQGAWHTVYTGVVIIFENDSICSYYEKADVHMNPQSDDEIWKYIKTGDPMDKAGAYGVQDSTCNFVDEVRGEIETVIGLPVLRLKKILAQKSHEC